MSRCAVNGCTVPTDDRKPFCAGHWPLVPGRLRSRLSFAGSFPGNPIYDADVRRAVDAIGRKRDAA